ncbi:MAG: protein TolR [Desulfurivibrionaceae bacterium]|nr:protein TolR [Desulfobulbales bacterium]MDT8334086.1 protein TolR [Desulfurivibrionaceae bacterium]
MGFTPRNGKGRLVADINVTPLVDVMLVLLIIFMITAPMMSQGVDVDLPETTAKPLPQKEKPIMISLDREGAITIDRIEVNRRLLRQKLEKLAVDGGKDRPVFLNADKNVPYGQVVGIMADLKDSGFDKLGMITNPLPYDKAEK